jgi:hypothetical protein
VHVQQVHLDDGWHSLSVGERFDICNVAKGFFLGFAFYAGLFPSLAFRSLVRLQALDQPTLGDRPTFGLSRCYEKDFDPVVGTFSALWSSCHKIPMRADVIS